MQGGKHHRICYGTDTDLRSGDERESAGGTQVWDGYCYERAEWEVVTHSGAKTGIRCVCGQPECDGRGVHCIRGRNGDAGTSNNQPGQHDQLTDGGADSADRGKLMATTTVTPTSTTPNWLTLVQLFSNVALTGLTAGGVLPPGTSLLVSGIENAILPLLSNIQGGQTKTQDTLAAFGAMVGILQATSKQTGLSAQQLSNIQALETAVSDAIVAFMTGESGAPDLATLAVPVPAI